MHPKGRPAPSVGRARAHRLRAWLATAAFLLAAGACVMQAANAQTQRPGRTPGRDRPIILNVRTPNGTPVNAAVALLNSTYVVPADAQGVIRIELRPPLRLPVQVVIH